VTRVLAAVLVLCTQVLAVFGTGNLVVCTQDDGESAIELVGSECCRAAHEAEQRSSNGDAAQRAVTISSADRCTDVPYRLDQSFAAVGAHRRGDLDHDARAVPAALVAWAPPAVVVRPCESHLLVRGPPPETVPRPAISFVRRC
jgi:hypothetical protein